MNTEKLCECGCGQPVRNRFLQGHNSKAAGYTPQQRFWKFVIPISPLDCWIWQGATRNGYGVMNINYKVIYAHRFCYELHFGPPADGLYICHTCDNRSCCNPHHLWAGTQGDNLRDMYAKGRGKIEQRTRNWNKHKFT